MTIQQGKLETWPSVQEFLFAGNATVTLRSLKTGDRFTYKIRAKKEDVERRDQELALQQIARSNGVILNFVPTPVDITYFVNLLRGPDNTGDFTYMGVLRKPGQFNLTPASKVGRSAPSFKALVWFLDAMRCERAVLADKLEVWHSGHCGRCGRKLTVPESISAGLGPDCIRKAA